MPLNARENINGITPQDLNKMNNNFMGIWKTLYGGLDFSDTNSILKKKIQTQQMPIQGEGNFDKNFPLYIRFFVPSNTKSVTSTSFNMICERYRMDSSVTKGGGGVAGGSINLSLASANTGVSSVSSASGTGATTSPVNKWYAFLPNGNRIERNPPTGTFYAPQPVPPQSEMFQAYVTGNNILGVKVLEAQTSRGTENLIDMDYLNHEHYVTIQITPHSHSITLQPHTHSGTASIDLPEHIHDLNEGVKISSQDAQNVVIKLNGNVVANMDSMSNSTKNDVDVKDFVKIGQWNIIECTTSSLARLTVYGIIELVMNY